MKAPRFEYVRPATVGAALQLLQEKGADARLLAGGQSLLAALAFRLSEPALLIDISKLPELLGVTEAGGVVRVGAGTTHSKLAASAVIKAKVPLVAEAIPHIAHPAIRNRGTIGGSLAYADPAAELPACCLALEATMIAAGPRGERRIAAKAFFTGLFTTALEADEILTAIEFPAAGADERSALVEIARRSGDYAMAGVAVKARVTAGSLAGVRAVFFGVGDAPVLAKGACAALEGNALGPDRIREAKAALAQDLDPAPDQHGAPDMKRHLAGVVLERALVRLTGAGVEKAA